MQPSADPPVAVAPGLVRLASRLAAPADADDLVQATYLRALEHGGPAPARPSWLRAVLRNEQWMALRSHMRRDARERELEPEPSDDVEHVVHCLRIARLVHALVDGLPDDLAVVVRARYFEGRSAAEIAQQLGIPAGTVRWRLKVGLDRLRDELDARHGGERLLWAGAFAPPLVAPTLGTSAASGPATAGGTSAAAAKGWSAMGVMSIKVLMGAAIAAGGVTAVYVGTERTPTTIEAPQVERAAAPSAAVPVRVVASTDTARASTPAGKAAWAQRRTKIHTAHGSSATAPAQAPTPGMDWTAAAHPQGDPTWQHAIGACDEPGCMQGLAAEVLTMVEGCHEFMGAVPPQATLEAKVIGAPEVGTIVESVDFTGGVDVPADLRECLTESMYTLELGATDRNFAQTLTLLLGGHQDSVAALAGADVDPETRAKIEAAIAEAGKDGKPGEVRMIMLGDRDDAPQPE